MTHNCNPEFTAVARVAGKNAHMLDLHRTRGHQARQAGLQARVGEGLGGPTPRGYWLLTTEGRGTFAFSYLLADQAPVSNLKPSHTTEDSH